MLFLERLLKEDKYYNGVLDGSCGDGLDAAIRQAQSDMGLKVDGDFGPTSWKNYLQF